MNITIEVASSTEAMCAASRVREQVFGHQCYRRLPRLDWYDPTQILTLIARPEDGNEPIAALSLVETTGEPRLHQGLGLLFPSGARVARYTQLAVLKPYRGLRIPLRMVVEAQRRFVTPQRIGYTWLLWDADTAYSSSFCTELGFKPSARVFATEHGRSRVLMRQENTRPEQSTSNGARLAEPFLFQPPVFPRTVFEDEWVAQ